MRLVRVLTVLLVLVPPLGLLPGCAATDTRESTGEYLDDSMITARVKAAILREKSLRVGQINVETFKGVVQLSGFVDSPEAIDTAVQVASRVPGVRSVDNAMRVK